MSLRFRKSLKLAPGIRMNLSGGGLSWSLGPRGASVGIGKRGTFLNTGIPGTGLAFRQLLAGGGTNRQTSAWGGDGITGLASGGASSATQATKVTLTVSVSDEGVVTFKDGNGKPVSEYLIEEAKKQKGDAIKTMIQKACDDLNAQVSSLGELHLHVPNPNKSPSFQVLKFNDSKPIASNPKVPGFIAKFFRSKVELIDSANSRAKSEFEGALKQWDTAKADFDASEQQKAELIKKVVAGDTAAMEGFFGEVLVDIVWPRETLVSFEVRNDGTKLAFDVDLPELEDIPTKVASVPQRGFKLTVKDIGPTNIHKMYAKHIHSIAFRLLGEAFGMLPTVQEVTLSGYSQRKNKSTGHEQDDYLLSVVVFRTSWSAINFGSLESIDVIDALARFELRRDMTKTGIFKAIQPFG